MAKPESRRIKAARREDEATIILQLYHSYFGNWQKGAGDGSEEGGVTSQHRGFDLVAAAAYGSETARFWGGPESPTAVIRK
jgi:hypothetical protein